MRRCSLPTIIFIAVAGSFTSTSSTLAWSTKEHMQLARIAAERLMADEKAPPAMRQWLRDATPGVMDMEGEKRWFLTTRQGITPRGADGIIYWAVMPDVVVLMDTRNEK